MDEFSSKEWSASNAEKMRGRRRREKHEDSEIIIWWGKREIIMKEEDAWQSPRRERKQSPQTTPLKLKTKPLHSYPSKP